MIYIIIAFLFLIFWNILKSFITITITLTDKTSTINFPFKTSFGRLLGIITIITIIITINLKTSSKEMMDTDNKMTSQFTFIVIIVIIINTTIVIAIIIIIEIIILIIVIVFFILLQKSLSRTMGRIHNLIIITK